MKKDASLQLTTPIEFESLIEQVYTFDEMVKGVIDIDSGTIAMGGEWHADSMAVLNSLGSEFKDLWGFSYYFDSKDIEYQSAINFKPMFNHMNIVVENQEVIDKMNIVIKKYLL